ncbi:fimbrial protein [Providencia rettgeri]|uniref:fimbrial protein n=1 Tax=Providencia rettgeri TaxID=587 RepID=UPI0034E0D799
MKSIFYCLAIYLILVHAAQANVATSRTTFKGLITVATCNIVVGDDAQTVDMGEISSTELETRGRSRSVPFTIRLYGCSESDKIAKTLFDQTGTGASGTVIPVDGMTGVGLSLQDGGGNPITFNSYSIGQKIQEGNNALHFSVFLVKTGQIQAGRFSRVLHYSIKYE